MQDAYPLLLEAALNDVDGDAERAWRAWRGSVDLQQISWPEMQLIPILNGARLRKWIAGDPGAGIFRGIVRRAWAEAQVRLNIAHQISNQFEGGGYGPVIHIGPAMYSLTNSRKDSIRPVSEIRLLVAREHVEAAAARLGSSGWLLEGTLPQADSLDWLTFAAYSKRGIHLYAHWRVLPVTGEQALPCERDFLNHHEPVSSNGMSFRVLAPEYALLAALARRGQQHGDVVPWQVDAALIPLDRIDWSRFDRLASAYDPEAIRLLGEMRSLALAKRAPTLK